MALFNKFFSNKRKNLTTSTVQQNTSQFPFNKEQVRILLYRECDLRGRRLLFDSNAIQRVAFNNNNNNNNNNSNININDNNNSSNINNNNNSDNININDTIKNNHINSNNRASSTKQYNNNNSNNGANSNFIDVSDGFGYKYGRSTPDGGSIGEMVFGAVAMSFRGTSLKVHWLHSPSRILCSQVFLSPLQTKIFSHNSNNNNSIDTNYSDISSTETSSLSSFSLSVSVCVNDNLNGLGDVPTPELIESRLFACSGEDSGYSGGGTGTGSGIDPWNASSSSFCPQSSTRSSFGSVYSDQDSFRKMSIDSSATSELNSNFNKTSDGNLQRRVLRNLSTSFENRTSIADYIGYISDNNNNYQNHQVCGGSDSCVAKIRRNSETIENRSNPEMIRKKTSGDFIYHTSHGPYPSRSNNRRAKLGLVIQITLSESREIEMQTFCSEHVALLESILCRLRTNAEKAYINRQNFLPLMLKAWKSTSLWITDLFTAPRIANPVWITLSSGNSKNPTALANNFMTELCGLLTYADTKDTRFFVSTLLTAILTHHLGWVGTVAPVSSQLNSSLSDIKKALRAKCLKMSEISKTHPYNALWAQMTDLYGAIGYPPKLSKTIVCGNDTNIIEKILNILTYFIRCGEIKRELNEKVIDKCTINNIMNSVSVDNEKNKIALNSKSNINSNESVINNTKNICYNKKQTGGSLTRSTTCVKDLSEMQENINIDNDNISNINNNNNSNKSYSKIDITFDTTDNTNLANAFKKNIMNDIPNVLAYRDSRFVQQELRIGNHLMDTGIVMDVKQKQELKSYQIKNLNDNDNNSNNNKNVNNDIKVTITSPDNYEFHVTHSVNKVILNNNNNNNVEENNVDSSNNHIKKIDKQLASTVNNNKQLDTDLRRTKSLHNKKETVKLTRKISVPKLVNLNDFNSNNDRINKTKLNNYNNSNDNINKIIKTCPSLGDLITANSVGQSERFLWGIEKVKEGISLEQKRHIELGEKIINRNDDINSVVFVLGDNEELIGLKNTFKHNNENDNHNNINLNISNKHINKVNDALCSISPSPSTCSTVTNANLPSASPSTSLICKPIKYIMKEPSEELIIESTLPPQVLMHKKLCNRKFKKHSGVKFNFEQYPQIATNYMKNKNLDIANYNFLEKGLKMEREMKWNYGQCSSETIVTPDSIAEHDDDDNHECDCCRGCEDSHILQTPSNASELEYSNDITTDDQTNYPIQSTLSSHKTPLLLNNDVAVELSDNSDDETNMAVINLNEKQQELKKNNRDIVPNLQIIELPISRSRDKAVKKSDNTDDSKLALSKEQPVLTPSLFTGITDHYIPDMVLQGTIESPSNFETSLRHDLMLASHCAIFEQTATENIAIIANTDKWDVHVVSSQSFVLPHGYGTQGSVGMSQLVASMLETVLVMWGAGTPAFQCMSYLEAKLQEMYLQSETLAAYLLGNDFCRLNTLTKALNLSENDVPLLLSVASIHSPQVSKKYGISFK